jgi:glucose/arabinose dehydrogenase
MRKCLDILQHKTYLVVITILLAGAAAVGLLVLYQVNRGVDLIEPEDRASDAIQVAGKTPIEPTLSTEVVAEGLMNPWETAFLPDGSILVNERRGTVNHLAGGSKKVIADIPGVYAVGEGGLTGLALDVDFAKNKFVYTCFNAQTASGIDVRLVRWRLNLETMQFEDRLDIVTGIPSSRSGRHSGCRIKAALDGTLWIGTGDAAVASHPQDPKSLGGKILHVTRDGMPAGDNLPAPFDPRIFSYGHRNVQGIVLFDEPGDTVFGYSVEHGSDRDDEVNLLKSGNFGWAPRVTYVEQGIPMTDLGRFPDAISALWSSGSPTIAPSGAIQLKGEQWGTWNGSLVVAVLKDKHVRIMKFDSENTLVLEKKIMTEFGRVRSANLSPDGYLYLTTDNGRNDKVIKVTAQQ